MTAVVSHAASVTEVVRVHSHAASVKDVVSHAASVTDVVRVQSHAASVTDVVSHAASVTDVVSHAASVTNVVRVRKEEVIEMRPSLKSSEKHLRHHWVDTFEYLKIISFGKSFLFEMQKNRES